MRLLLIAFMATASFTICLAANEGETLQTLRGKYSDGIRAIRLEYALAVRAMPKEYGRGLEDAIGVLTAAGDPEPVIAAKAEMRRFRQSGTVPGKLPKNVPPRVQNVWREYRELLEKARDEMRDRLTRETASYVTDLGNRMRTLTLEGDLDEARIVKMERELFREVFKDDKGRSARIEALANLIARTAIDTPTMGANLALDLGKGIRIEFVWIPAMRCWVGKYEVTNLQYRRCVPKHDSGKLEGISLNGGTQPVVNVSFHEAQRYAAWVRLICAGYVPAGFRVRLPTGTEWQVFAECGDGREYPWGDEWPPKYGNYQDASAKREKVTNGRTISGYDDGFPVTCPIRESGGNTWGLYGVGGNVWEWTTDVYAPGVDARVLRGGAKGMWDKRLMTCAFRDRRERPTKRGHGYGFRLVVAPLPKGPESTKN